MLVYDKPCATSYLSRVAATALPKGEPLSKCVLRCRGNYGYQKNYRCLKNYKCRKWRLSINLIKIWCPSLLLGSTTFQLKLDKPPRVILSEAVRDSASATPRAFAANRKSSTSSEWHGRRSRNQRATAYAVGSRTDEVSTFKWNKALEGNWINFTEHIYKPQKLWYNNRATQT